MQETINNNDDSSPSSSLYSFEWCFKPFIIILKFFTGVPINHSSSISKKSCCLAFYGSMLLLINAGINGYYIKEYYDKNFRNDSQPAHLDPYNNRPPDNRTIKISNKIDMGIDMINETFFIFGCPCCFFLLSLLKSTSFMRIWDCFLVIESQFQLTTQNYRRIRKQVVLSLCFLILVIASNFGMSQTLADAKSGNNLDAFSSFSISTAKTLSCTILSWFLVLVSTSIVLFNVLNERLGKMVEIGLNEEKVVEGLMTWKEHHALVCKLVTCINKSFGLILAIAFSHGFVTFITNFYRFVSDLNIQFLMIFIHQAIFLSIFIVASYNLQSWGGKLSECVFKFRVPLNNVTSQNLLNSVLIQVTQVNLKITAADLFDINLTLYSVILGTTLTYVIILCQTGRD